MKPFHCDGCGNLVFFENVRCVKCQRTLGFLPQFGELSALEPAENGLWKPLISQAKPGLYRQCNNSLQHQVCNWMIPQANAATFCLSCSLNEMIPDLTVPENLERWRKLETAKRRIIYTILRLGLPMEIVPGKNYPALRFKFIGDPPGGPAITTGHENGVITVNIAEADDVERERRRVNLHEPYRTLLGHLRHEVAHYYWDRLIPENGWLAGFRELFGDETRDYTTALQSHYQQGAPADWQSHYVSAYASSHPWEDWAETWAHYFHTIDTMETAAAFGMTLRPRNHSAEHSMTADPAQANASNTNFDTLLENWFPLTYALNSFNRGMGLPDLYPFVLSGPAIEKLRFIHQVIEAARIKRKS
jgi:hypothetical protein